VASDAGELDGARFDVAVDATGVPAAIAVSPFRVYNDEITIVGSMAILRSFGRAVDQVAHPAVVTGGHLTPYRYSSAS